MEILGFGEGDLKERERLEDLVVLKMNLQGAKWGWGIYLIDLTENRKCFL